MARSPGHFKLLEGDLILDILGSAAGTASKHRWPYLQGVGAHPNGEKGWVLRKHILLKEKMRPAVTTVAHHFYVSKVCVLALNFIQQRQKRWETEAWSYTRSGMP